MVRSQTTDNAPWMGPTTVTSQTIFLVNKYPSPTVSYRLSYDKSTWQDRELEGIHSTSFTNIDILYVYINGRVFPLTKGHIYYFIYSSGRGWEVAENPR